MKLKISKGDPVQFRRKFQDEGDENFKRFAIEDEDGGRVRIKTIIPGLKIHPTEVVQTSMLKRVKA